MSDLPVIFDQRSPTGFKYRGPTRMPGWELIDVFHGYPSQDYPPFQDKDGIEAVRKEMVRIGAVANQ